MKENLILLTNYYPYYKGEEYLESEIIFLSSKFKNIIVIPTMINQNMGVTRDVPNNVKVLKVKNKLNISSKIKLTTFGLVNYKIKSHSDKNDKLIEKVYSKYFESRSQHVFKNIKHEVLKEIINMNYTDTVIYSYWFYITARVGILINETFFESKAKVVSRGHGYDINEKANKLNFLPQRKFMLENIDFLYPISDEATERLSNKYPEYSSKIKCRRLGTFNKNQTLKVLEHCNSNIIVTCSTVRKLKRIDLLIEALKLLKESNIDYKWIHFGNGPEFEEIKKLANSVLDLNDFEFKGYVSNSELHEWYEENNVKLFVNVSSSEGVPVSIMEAMSYSIPIIATDVGGTSEIVKNGVNGYILSGNTSSIEIYIKIKELFELDSVTYYKMSKNSYELWKNTCEANQLYLNFVNELVEVDKERAYIK